MASSSTHSTSQETKLHACWRVVHIRLRSISANHQAAYVTEQFAEVLDVSYHDLAHGFWPPGPAGKDREVVKVERDIGEAVRSQGEKMGDADRINSAANAAMEASEHLKQYGRESEGQRMEELGELIYCHICVPRTLLAARESPR